MFSVASKQKQLRRVFSAVRDDVTDLVVLRALGNGQFVNVKQDALIIEVNNELLWNS